MKKEDLIFLFDRLKNEGYYKINFLNKEAKIYLVNDLEELIILCSSKTFTNYLNSLGEDNIEGNHFDS